MPMWTVQETERFRRALEEINAAGYDWSDSLKATWWYLERGPMHVGYGTQDSEVRIVIVDGPRGIPSLKVFYLVEAATVTLLSVRVAEPAQL
jgi:hypothetical protein